MDCHSEGSEHTEKREEIKILQMSGISGEKTGGFARQNSNMWLWVSGKSQLLFIKKGHTLQSNGL